MCSIEKGVSFLYVCSKYISHVKRIVWYCWRWSKWQSKMSLCAHLGQQSKQSVLTTISYLSLKSSYSRRVNVCICWFKVRKKFAKAVLLNEIGPRVCARVWENLKKNIFFNIIIPGDFCEVAAARQVEPVQVILPLTILALLLACVAVYIWWYLKQSRKMKGKYNPAKAELDGGMPMAMFDLETDERLIWSVAVFISRRKPCTQKTIFLYEFPTTYEETHWAWCG